MVTKWGHDGRGLHGGFCGDVHGGCCGIAGHHLLTLGTHLSVEYGLGMEISADIFCEKQHP
jgi:hypothetical protein